MKESFRLPQLFALCRPDNDGCQGIIEDHRHGACEKRKRLRVQLESQAISLYQRPSYIALIRRRNLLCIMVERQFFAWGIEIKNFDTGHIAAIIEYIKPYS